MNANREELKHIIDHLPESDIVEVWNVIGYLKMKRNHQAAVQQDVEAATVFAHPLELHYLRLKLKEFERNLTNR